MSPIHHQTNLEKCRSDLMMLNHEFFSLLEKRRSICLRIQELKNSTSRFSCYDPEREVKVFTHFLSDIRRLSIGELLAFSLIMEEHALAFSPRSYPQWSQKIHLMNHDNFLTLFELINPLLLKAKDEISFNKLKLSSEFSFLKDFSFS